MSSFRRSLQLLLTAAAVVCAGAVHARSESALESAALGQTVETIRPLLQKYCWDCHADGASEGQRSFDAYESDAAILADRDLWWAVLKNVRADIMPPGDAPRPSAEEKRLLSDWIKQEVFGADPADPDPGRVTIRRLNREEYRNTIRDLMGVDYDTSVEFPPDDSGHGFDNLADALSLSPLLMEKYLTAAEAIVEEAVPLVGRELPVAVLGGERWRSDNKEVHGGELDFYKAVTVSRELPTQHSGKYRLIVEGAVQGGFDFDPGRCRLTCRVDDTEAWSREFVWAEDKPFRMTADVALEPGERRVSFTVEPLTPEADKKQDPRLRIRRVRIEGPLDPQYWKPKPGYNRFFTRAAPPAAEDEAGRTEYTRELLSRFAFRAFRRPIDAPTLERLVALAREVDRSPDRSFEQSIAQAITAILASPRFLFRFEDSLTGRDDSRYPLIDEF
ncbi:MAG: DUF1587 domain-containing protein, partial [Planctomycetaceae bacterium]|nr:DUF1587 domain-containing protein [Planctomycetaceae bacterium]